MKLDKQTAEKLNKLKGETNWNDLMEKFIEVCEIEEQRFVVEFETEKPQSVRTNSFALKHEHDPDKIKYLCEQHHALAHHGLIENEEQYPKAWLTRRQKDVCDFRNVINMKVAEFRR